MARRLTYNEVKEFIENKGCKLISKEYKNNATKLEIRCSCREIYCVDYNTFRKGQTRCKKCYWIENEHHNKYTYEYIKKYIEENSDSKLLSKEYKNGSTKLSIQCGICKDEFKKSFYDIRRSQSYICPKCSKEIVDEKFRFSVEDMNNYLDSINSRFTIVEKCDSYKNQYDDVIARHIDCNKTFKVPYKTLALDSKVCPHCEVNMSKGVVVITRVLTDLNIKFETEFKFDDCKNERRLPFDFYLKDYNMCIEFDGEQHFKPIEKFGGKEKFNIQVKNDNIKNDYCKSNNIKLLRIRFDEVNQIEEIIKKSIPR